MVNQAVILVGGLGTRLGQRTAAMPKPLLTVAGKPFLEHLLDEVTRYGVFDDIVLLAGYLGSGVAETYHGRRWRHATIKVVVEPGPLGTGGALLNARDALQSRFLLLNGDSFFDCNLLDFVAAPWPTGALGRMALLSDHPGDRYGRVEVAGDRVGAFLPPLHGHRGPMNAGIYVLDRAILDLLPTPPCSLERDLFPQLAPDGRLAARVYDRFFIDIGIPEDLARADRELAAQRRRPAVFLDRDGVLNRDVNYVHRPDQVVWVDSAKDAVKECNDRGAYVFVVTNQAGVARGYYDEAAVETLHRWMTAELAAVGAHVDAFEYCPHHVDATVERYRRACRRRKPEAGMILDLIGSWPVDIARSMLVGDNDSDVAAAVSAGIDGFLFPGGNLKEFLMPVLQAHLENRSIIPAGSASLSSTGR